jgi:2'-5' RNA ligase
MSSARYAIYLAPPPGTPLWTFGSRVLGYDAASGEDVPGFAPEGVDPARWRQLTARPRAYGFHGTLKAPFRLSADTSLQELEEDLSRFCRTNPPFELGPLAVNAIMQGGQGFVALMPLRDAPGLAVLEQEVVRRFDRFRAPLTDVERSKRRPEALTARQREALLTFGYPYVGPDYRFHMTLSGAIPDAAEMAKRLADAMADQIGAAHFKVDALVLFAQESADARFKVLRRFALCGTECVTSASPRGERAVSLS